VNRQPISRSVFAAFLWIAALVAVPLVASGQDATPGPAGAPLQVPLVDKSGADVGTATFSEGPDGVTLSIHVEGLEPGEHGWHLHAMGVCEGSGLEPFGSAGPHWNPTNMRHGAPDTTPHHAGDFGNFTAGEDGVGEAEITTRDYTLGEGPTSVFDEDGTALIIHAGRDDLVSQPAGNSGARYACGVVARPKQMPAQELSAMTPANDTSAAAKSELDAPSR
jgi:superoxide dismutase, Cu-Zn family